MANPSLAALLKRLDDARIQHGSVSEPQYLQLLTAVGTRRFRQDAQSLIACTTYVVPARFSAGQRVLRQADRLLAGFEKRVKRHWPLAPMRMSSRRKKSLASPEPWLRLHTVSHGALVGTTPHASYFSGLGPV